MKITDYRVPNEFYILALTLFLVVAVVGLTAVATLCLSVIFVCLAVLMAYSASQSQHQALIRKAWRVTDQKMPEMATLVRRGAALLQPGSIDVFVAPSQQLNAYTFGLSSPKVVVLYSSLFQVMEADELLFILGHELGHVALGHTWLNSLVGGMAGIPSPSLASAVLTMAFLSWNRSCELSADRAGLLACGSLEKAVSALIKLVAGPTAHTRTGLEVAYRRIDAEDDTIWGNLAEALGSHPLLIHRIEELRRYAGTEEYHRLQARVNQNLA
jgi:Zn-dependent protease with chaperone function